jgi:7,8-dihydropterin-6-yl-methyl-4-(beta-D-ribofuranosyl)aminobenzene 5'-phosphate synthase
MIIKALAENTSVREDLGCEHGLSLYIETTAHKILFDTGTGELFAKNARLMEVDLRQVDIAFISHGHYDHGGGPKTFLSLNDKRRSMSAAERLTRNYANFGENW